MHEDVRKILGLLQVPLLAVRQRQVLQLPDHLLPVLIHLHLVPVIPEMAQIAGHCIETDLVGEVVRALLEAGGQLLIGQLLVIGALQTAAAVHLQLISEKDQPQLQKGQQKDHGGDAL